MPRLARLVFPGVALHVIQRGHNRRACFKEDADRLVYLALLRDGLKKSGCALHAYCLMTNHVHLLVTPADARGCEVLMRSLGQRYVQYFNGRYGRSGTLWEGRPHSCLVESARYVLACYRYIECNPVRAGMVPFPAAHPWSSHAVNTGSAEDSLVSPHVEYDALAADAQKRRAAYLELFAGGEDPDFVKQIRDATNGGYPMVSEEMKASLAMRVGRRLERRKPGPRAAGAEHESLELPL